LSKAHDEFNTIEKAYQISNINMEIVTIGMSDLFITMPSP